MIWLPVIGNYADIDVYASIIAYTDLLNQRGKPAKAYIPPHTPNYSVLEELRCSEYEGATFDLQPNDEAIILDISEPDAIDRLVPTTQILELIDHHPGYEEYWQERLGERAIIEPIGAVATSIFEWWGECWDYAKMTPQIAKLLLAAVLDNTLNFNAKITTNRDCQAARELAKIGKTELADFTEWYFSAVSKVVLADFKTALLQDCKIVKLPQTDIQLGFGQLTLWDAKDAISQTTALAEAMATKYSDWIISVICIAEAKNYILCSSNQVADYFTKLLNLKQDGNWLISNSLYLRKEILRKMLA